MEEKEEESLDLMVGILIERIRLILYLFGSCCDRKWVVVFSLKGHGKLLYGFVVYYGFH